MQNTMFKRLLELSKRTGDRIVFADVEKGEAHVVLSLDDYEKLVLGSNRKEKAISENLTVSEVKETKKQMNALDEISREVVKTLESEHEEQPAGRGLALGDDLELETEERYYLEPIE